MSYDLFPKFQRCTTGTRFGNRDEFLRMIVVDHICGLEAYAAIVLNHITGSELDLNLHSYDYTLLAHLCSRVSRHTTHAR